MKTFVVTALLMALAVPSTAATFNSRIAFMENLGVDTKTYTYTGSLYSEPTVPTPYYVEDDVSVEGFEFDFRLKNERGVVTISINGYENSAFNIRSLDREPFQGFYYYVSPDESIQKDKYDPDFMNGRGWTVSWQDFEFVTTPRGKTEIFPYGFVFHGDLGDWGEFYTNPRYQGSYYFADVRPFTAPIPVPVPASFPLTLAGIAAMGLLTMRRRNPLD